MIEVYSPFLRTAFKYRYFGVLICSPSRWTIGFSSIYRYRNGYLRCKIYKVSKDQKTEDTEIIKIGKKLIEERRNR